MRAIKLLQYGTILQVFLILAAGLGMLIWRPGNMEDYRMMVGAVGPFILLQIASAFGGSPLKKFLENARAKIENGAGHAE